ncbi:type II CAAX endopeptidase family protein [Spirulina sp. 06S082]|uniref:CPBP family intramembrane glutamic endopeptidase n=1 Tax=Spirulina sp. 06S082 TaxID=3110248 RepID=UPI002B1F771C|nr:type II CAAX endopeptidase family protein [Spirulina sp. 06S082]MEA5468210.1 type II CAAX endopeptidase family protein [Spirulina sp. 06S082]
MTRKRLILLFLTVFAIAKIFLSLGASWNEPQVQSRLQLFQTDLVLHGAEFATEQGDRLTALLGKDTYLEAQKQYEKAKKEVEQNRDRLQAQLAPEISSPDRGQAVEFVETPQQNQILEAIAQIDREIDELDVNVGILQASRGELKTARETWQNVQGRSPSFNIANTVGTLQGLWQEPMDIASDAEITLQNNLKGWFRFQALSRLYEGTQQEKALSSLQAEEEAISQGAIVKLAFIAGIPIVGGVFGISLLLVLLAQWILQKERSLLGTSAKGWEVAWDGEVTWQVLIVGFFALSQLILPLVIPLAIALLGLNIAAFSLAEKALYILITYLLMTMGGFSVLYFSIRSFFPLPEGWFRFQWLSKWVLWGMGGYFVAVPLVLIVSLVNQQIWQGQGGGNPIILLALQAQDRWALFLFWITAALAAPVFEEIMFRGFLLPSLTRYVPVWGAIGISGLIFAIAHLSLAEVLPLTVLGIILGFVYARSRNLLASILLHSLWNSGTLLSLFILGSNT